MYVNSFTKVKRAWVNKINIKNYWFSGFKFEFFVVSLILAVLLLVFFEKPIFHNKVLAPTDILQLFEPFNGEHPDNFHAYNSLASDLVLQMHPWLQFQRDELRHGRIPLWNPYAFAGIPHLANGQSAVFYPLNIFSYLFSLPVGLQVSAFLKLYLAGLLTYYYLREIRISPPAALFGGVAFMFCGYHVLWLGWPHTNVSIFLPGLFLFIERATEEKNSKPAYAFFALILAFQFLGGHPETSLFIITASCLYFLFKILTKQIQQPGKALKHSLAFVIAGIAGFFLAAVQLFPFIEYLWQSVAWVERNYAGINTHFLPWSYLALIVVPNFYGNPVDQWAVVNYNESTMGYVGVFTVVMATVALFYRRDQQGKVYHFFFLGLAILCVAIIYNFAPIFDLITKLPLFKASANHRFSVVLAFALATLGAMGVERIRMRSWRNWLRVGAGLLFVGTGLVFVRANLSPGHETYIKTYLGLAVLFMGSGTLVVSLRNLRILPFSIAAAMLVMFLAGDIVLMYGRRYESAIDPILFYPANPILNFIKHQTSEERTLFVNTPLSRNFPPNLGTYYNIPGVRGYDAMKLARYEEIQRITGNFRGNWQEITQWNDRLLDLLNVKYLVSQLPLNFNYQTAQDKKNTPVGEIAGEYTVGQVFKAEANNLAGIVLDMGTLERNNDQDVYFYLKTAPEAKNILRTITINASSIKDNGLLFFNFEPLSNSANQSYYFYLESPTSAHGNAVTFWGFDEDVYPYGNAIISGVEFPGDVRFLIAYAKPQSEHYKQVFQGSRMQIFENPDALPRAFMVNKALIMTSDEEILGTLKNPAFDFRTHVILEEPAALWPPSSNTSAVTTNSGIAEMESYQPAAVKINTNSRDKGYLVITDNFYPGWKAFVDNERQPIYRANYTFRAIPIPAGEHQVDLLYEPLSFKLGLWISGISWSGLIIFILGLEYTQKFKNAQFDTQKNKNEVNG